MVSDIKKGDEEDAFCNLFGVNDDNQIFNERDNATSFDFRFFSVVHLDLQNLCEFSKKFKALRKRIQEKNLSNLLTLSLEIECILLTLSKIIKLQKGVI